MAQTRGTIINRSSQEAFLISHQVNIHCLDTSAWTAATDGLQLKADSRAKRRAAGVAATATRLVGTGSARGAVFLLKYRSTPPGLCVVPLRQ